MRNLIIKQAINTAISNKTLRSVTIGRMDKEIKKRVRKISNTLPAFSEKRYQWFSALMHQLNHNLNKGCINKNILQKSIHTFIGKEFTIDKTERIGGVKEKYKQKYGDYPPMLVTLSPTQACNLNCEGCYACSDPSTKSKLPFNIVKRIIQEMHDEMGSRFIVISGGEPLMYRDGDKTIFDVFAHFQDMYFLMYTNGALLNITNCEKLARLGNVTPAISVEGFEKQTDARRGKGMYNKIVAATENLRNIGIPFGVSITATSQNIDAMLNENFYDHIFNDLGATYMYIFHIMPVGRAKDTLPLLISSQQRVDLYRLCNKMLKEKKYCIADFWNSGDITDGCIAYGRWGGYFYIDWDGKIMPCVFVPFYEDTIYDIYKRGQKLPDALQSNLFKNGRCWQKKYGFNSTQRCNVLMPCSIKDHYQNFMKNILTKDAKPENEEAKQMIEDAKIKKALTDFEKELEMLTTNIWEEEYLKQPSIAG